MRGRISIKLSEIFTTRSTWHWYISRSWVQSSRSQTTFSENALFRRRQTKRRFAVEDYIISHVSSRSRERRQMSSTVAHVPGIVPWRTCQQYTSNTYVLRCASWQCHNASSSVLLRRRWKSQLMFSERDVVTETEITFSLHAISTLAHYNEICNKAFQIP